MRKMVIFSLCLVSVSMSAQAQLRGLVKSLGKVAAKPPAAQTAPAPAASAGAGMITEANFVPTLRALVARDGVIEMGEAEPRRYRISLRLSGLRERDMLALPARLQVPGYNETYVRCSSFTAASPAGKPVGIAIDDWQLMSETVEESNLVILAAQCRVEGGVAAARPAAPAAPERDCVPKEGYAGVASYRDPRMEQVGTEPIRSFDQYVFKARRTVNTGKAEMLEGAFYGYDGRVSAGSWVMADEWDCR